MVGERSARADPRTARGRQSGSEVTSNQPSPSGATTDSPPIDSGGAVGSHTYRREGPRNHEGASRSSSAWTRSSPRYPNDAYRISIPVDSSAATNRIRSASAVGSSGTAGSGASAQ